MEKTYLTGGTTGGKVIPDNRDEFLSAFRVFEGKRWEITLEEYEEERTKRQNRYLWSKGCYGVLVRGYRNQGYDVNEEAIHHMMGEKFRQLPIFKDGEIVGHYFESTATMGKKRFHEYVEQLAQHSAEDLGEVIEDPRKYIKDF